ncbi:MAG: sulfatase-like hydrolase/transferase [Candidatus Aminicenantes bacterium]|nr:sulfatase-like hydrolase/transferase [Candidatus Aminicenantes bacterium]
MKSYITRGRFPLLLFLGCLLSAPALRASLPKDANVLLITIDTLRYDRIGILSDKYVKTPRIDALARQSLVFTNAYAQSTLTRPSHTNILTGTTPLYHGVSDNPGFKLESRYLTLTEYLKERAYRTAAFIGNFILDARFGLNKGFDLYNDSNGDQNVDETPFVERSADQVVAPAMDWIAGQKSKWFCWIHLFDPHDPYAPPEPFKTQYQNDLYSGEVAFVDAQLGRLFDLLEKNGEMRKTIIIFTSDHGEAFGEKDEIRHGFFAYNNVLHVPLILYYPGSEPKTVGTNACHIDIFPTVCELLEIPIPSVLQGESLLPLADGKDRQKALIYFESLSPHFFIDAAPLYGFIRGDLKFIDQPVKEVYDLNADPLEDRNIASSADIPQLVKELDALKKSFKGAGTKQDLEGKNSDIKPLLESLGYVSGKPTKTKGYGIQDDLKTLHPLMAQLRLAVEEFESGKREAALKKLASIVRIRPSYVTAHSALADAYFKNKQTDLAVAALKDGLAKNPDNIHLTSRLGTILVMTKKYKDAIGPLEDAANRDKDNPDAFNYLGLAYMGAGDFKFAQKNFEKALKLDPDMIPVFNNLGYMYMALFVKTNEMNYIDSAIQYFDRALKINPKLPSALKGKAAAAKYKNDRNASAEHKT